MEPNKKRRNKIENEPNISDNETTVSEYGDKVQFNKHSDLDVLNRYKVPESADTQRIFCKRLFS